MPIPNSHELTRLLRAWSEGDQDALNKLTPLIYKELHRLARHYLSREPHGQTFRPRRSSTRPTPDCVIAVT